MADVAFYGNALKNLISDPGSFQGSPGFQFALNSGMDNIGRQAAARGMNYSGNVLGDLTKYGVNLGLQDYGNQVDRLGKLSGQEQQYDLGQGQNANTAIRNANDLTLGQGNLALGTYRAGNDYALGQQQNSNTAQNNWWNYTLGGQQNANTAANNQNQFNLGTYNAQTNRGSAQSNSLLDWTRLGYNINPAQRVAGVPGASGGGWAGIN